MVPLTHEQQEELQRTGGGPVHLTDQRTQQEYVLLRAEDYERMRRFLEAEVVDPSLCEFEPDP